MAKTILTRARPRLARPPAAQTIDGDYGSALWRIVNGFTADECVRLPVNERTVSGLTGAWAAVAKISNAVGQMMSCADALGPDGITEIATPTVLSDPCSGYDSFTYWREVTSTALMRGNWIGLKLDPDPVTGYPRQVMPMPIDSVHAFYDEGYAIYEIAGEHFSPDDVVHVRVGLTLPGQIMAIGVIEAHRRGLGGMLDLQGMASSVWQQGAVPSGVVQMDVDHPTQAQADMVKANWVTNLGGKRTVAITGKAMTYVPITWSAQDAQFLQSQQFTIAECALMFGLRPEDLGSSFGASAGAMTYGNRTDDALQRIIDSYTPVMLPIEQAWSRLIPGKNYVQGDVDALMRSTTKERYELRLLAQQTGIETVDESREAEGKPPLTDEQKADRPQTPVKQIPNEPTTDQKLAIPVAPLPVPEEELNV